MNKKCILDNCNKERYGNQLYCEYHYRRNLKYGDPLYKINPNKICQVEGCKNKYHAKGYCIKHYREQISNPKAKEFKKQIQEKLFVENTKHVSMKNILEYILNKYNIDLKEEIREYWNNKQ